jgi:two-component system response regulator AlgR
MRILIVDDESLARDRIRRILLEQNEHEVLGEASNGQEALQKIDALHPDVVLLDIRMPGIDGLEVARHLVGMDEPPAVIFTTAYDEYALEAFKVHAVDYLLKPVRPERLSEALQKALKPNKVQWKSLNRKEDGTPKARTHISSRTRRGIVLVPIGEIYYFRAEHKYVTVRHKEGEVLIEDTLKELETEFGERFLRVHRNCLVSMEHIQALEKNSSGQPCIRLRGVEETLDVSRRHVAKVRQIMSGG